MGLSIGSGDYWSRRRYGDEVCQPPEVLEGGGEEEFVARAEQSFKAQSRQAEVPFEVAEAGLDPLALASGLSEGFGLLGWVNAG